jgi:hypothetical protein
MADNGSLGILQEFTERMSREAMESLQQAAMSTQTPSAPPMPTAALVEAAPPAKSAKPSTK